MDTMEGEGVKPYSFEPKYTAEEILERRRRRLSQSASAPPSPPAPDPEGDRLDNNDWCFCGECTPMETVLQSRCCVELANCRTHLNESIPCITAHPDFMKVCLEKAVLRTALVARLDTRGLDVRNIPAELENESYRYCGYRMFTYWIHGVLGRHVRRVIPACSVQRIRDTFPAADGRYVEFRFVQDEVEVVPEEYEI
ncbi:P2X purinoceptor 7-like [Lytechinus variegatus]|uniref:P2X purinoceptor 7-like n=1 Tax=Lytechinus variegatus TaxID=7654 RepID=UPI001BB226A8|nr:P2X purinoceptor 7-like [Lytechinus variegatus]